MTLITAMIKPSRLEDARSALTDRGVQSNRHRIMDEKPFVTSPDVLRIHTGERGTDAVQTPAARI